jgi:hypothetical protein
VNEADIWQIIQTGNEISVMRTEVFITITVGVLVISSIHFIRLNVALLSIMLGSYFVFGFINFTMLVGEMHILLAGISQLDQMVGAGEDVSFMGKWLSSQLEAPTTPILIPTMHATYWAVTISTIGYAIWRYTRQRAAEAVDLN